MSSIDLYLYYGEEPCGDVTYGVTYEGPGKKLEIIQLKKRQEINLKKLKKKIMKKLDLDRRLHDIKIIYRTPHAVFSDRIVFMPIEIKGVKHIKIMFDRINSTPQLKVVELYISVKPCIKVGDEDVQQTTLDRGGKKEFQSLHTDSYLTLTSCITIGVIHHNVKRHQLQWRFANLVINKNVFNLYGGKTKTKTMLIKVEMSMKR